MVKVISISQNVYGDSRVLFYDSEGCRNDIDEDNRNENCSQQTVISLIHQLGDLITHC